MDVMHLVRWNRRHASSAAALAHRANASKVARSVKDQLRAATNTGTGHLHDEMTKRVYRFQTNSNLLFVGMDVSSRCTGIAIVDARGRGVASHACETHNYPDVITVGQRIRSDMADLFSRVELERRNEESESTTTTTTITSSNFEWHAGIEACAKNFTRGRFNAKGLVKLAQINGIAQYICAESIGEIPLVVNPSTARSFYEVRNSPIMTGGTRSEAGNMERKSKREEDENEGTVGTIEKVGMVGMVDDREEESDEERGMVVVEEPTLVKESVKERVFQFVQNRETGMLWHDETSSSRSRLDISDAFLIAWYTRVNHVFGMLAEDELLWKQFGLELRSVKPAASRREIVASHHKLLWDWLRQHRMFLNM